ncbi:talin-1-like isoform X5 [Patiria miniata]|uniref:Talin n=1 Tax=Patiria miniata TaxID=46514 RepID=A0A913Z5P3_PATMI|nr:talin-1-like isoform X5 [Patiria miniata]
MAAKISLKINIVAANSTKTMQFDPTALVFDVCRSIRDKNPEAAALLGQPNEYGLFLADEDPKKGVWLESGKTLEHYLLRQGDLLEYRKKIRPLKVKMLDGSKKTLLIDDSNTVSQMLVTICTRLGVTNYDEYSLCRDVLDDEKKDGTINRSTLKKEKGSSSILRDEKKMETLKRKLHTDDELNWLDHTRTLREQGVEEFEMLVFRRKYFYSDQNVDKRDPVQLNLLYVQSRDAIINGTHPCSYEEALHLAGTQMQIHYGDHDPNRHKLGFLELKDFLPREYVKLKGAEKRIFGEHAKLIGVSELDSKVRYTQLCRSLKTYGITFFLVKEKMKGKNKLVPRLMGVTKESVLRVDEKTKEIMKTWLLTTVRRWAASPNSFTLDFGDYSESYYSVQTKEGEAIGALIAGYIDIILKKQKGKDRMGLEGEEESTLLEDSVSPAKATFMQHQTNRPGHASEGSVALPAVMRAGGSAGTYTTGEMQPPQHAVTKGQANMAHTAPMPNQARQPGMTTAQQALQGNVERGFTAVDAAQNDLMTKAELPPLGTDPASKQWRQNTIDVNKQNIQSQLSAMSAATAGIISQTSGDPSDTDYTSVGSHITTISSNLTEMTKGVKMLAALLGEEGDGNSILDAARGLMGAFSDLLKYAQPENQEPRQNLLSAANRVGEAQNALLRSIGSTGDMDPKFQDLLLGLAKAVANATAALVLKAKNVASTTEDQALQNKVIGSATQCALNTSQLVACTKVVAPTISSPACQEQLVEAAKLVAQSVEAVVDSSKNATEDENLLRDLGEAATAVTKALNDLLQHVKQGTAAAGRPTTLYDDACDKIMTATEKLFSSVGNAAEMVKQAKILAMATSHLVNAIKGDAEAVTESDSQKRLLGAAKQLADATGKMVEAAKACASSPHDESQQQRLKQAAEDLRTATNAAANNALKKKILQRLENAAKQAAATATQTIAASQGAKDSTKNPSTQQHLVDECKIVAEHIPKLVQGVRDYMRQPDNLSVQLALINASQHFIQPGTDLISASRAAIPTVEDKAAALQLANCTKNMATSLADLRSAANKAQEACGAQEIDNALDMIKALEDQLDVIRQTADNNKLTPLPGESPESCATQLGTTSKNVGASMAQLLTAASQANETYTGMAARETANSLQNLTGAVRGVAATTQEKPARDNMIDRAKDVLDKSASLLEEAKKALADPNNPDNQQRLAQVAKAVSHALNGCVSCLPGQRDVDKAIKSVVEASKGLMSGKLIRLAREQHEQSARLTEVFEQFSYTSEFISEAILASQDQDVALSSRLPVGDARNYQEHQNALNKAAQGLNVAASELVTSSRGTPQELASAANTFSKDFDDLMKSGMGMAGAAPSKEAQGEMVGSLKTISVTSSKLLLVVKAMSADPNAPNAKNLLAAAARGVTESINNLIDTFMQAAPGQKECDNSLRNIQTMKNILDNINEPINDWTYFDCLQGVMEKSKDLGESMGGITQNAKNGQLEEFGRNVEAAGAAVCGLTEAAAQSAYLVGIADPSSVAGRPGLVDQSQFARAHQAIQAACNSLLNPESSQQQVLAAATEVAKHTSALCNICRVASSKTSNPVAKKHFVQSAKDVANSTANLVKSIKALDGNFSDENRQKCAASTKPLLEAVENLVTFASSPEFSSVPAKITPQARQAMEPIISAGKMMIASSCALIQTAKPLALNPKDPPTWQQLANHSKDVSDSIKKLVSSIRDRAPGQLECDNAIEQVNQSMRDLDQASLAAMSQSLPPHEGATLKSFTEQMANSAVELKYQIDEVATASKGQAEKLGHAVSSMANYFDPLTRSAIGAASKTHNSQRQMAVLDLTKTVAESGLQLLYAAKEGGGNPKAVHTHSAIDEAAQGMKEAVDDLNTMLEEAASEFGIVSGMVDTISKAILKTDDTIPENEAGEFVDYQTSMVKSCKAIIKTSHDMLAVSKRNVSKANSNVGELGTLANNLSHEYSKLAEDSRGAMASTNPEVGPRYEVAQRIKSAVDNLGNASIELVKNAGTVQCSPTDNMAKKDLLDNARSVVEKCNFVMAALQAGSSGTQACINAASTVSGIIGDLDTTIMFASAGTLSAEPEGGSFADHRESILKTAKALVEDTKTLVTGAASTQEQLANAAQSAVSTITKLADVVKLGAATLGGDDPDGQVLLINAVKDVASALGDLISATKSASGKGVDDPTVGNLKSSAKVMVTNVTSLLKTVKSVEDEACRGTRALEATIDAITQEAKILDNPSLGDRRATPEQLIRSTKAVTLATAKAVGAGNSGKQDDVTAASNLARQALFAMIDCCRGAASAAESVDLRERTLYVGRQCADSYRAMLEQVHENIQRPSPDGKQRLGQHSKRVAQTVGELVQAAEALKGADWVDPEDPNVIAENELLSAANAIEAAAKKLAQLQPRGRARQADESLNFEEQILEAAKAIANATSALVKAASAAQRELVQQGMVMANPAPYSEDGQWSMGLISAARKVAAATQGLCEAANAVVQGHASQERLISSAKQVASSTAQLLVACKVKASTFSEPMRRLQAAGNAVKRASDSLVAAAQQAADQEDEVAGVDLSNKMVGNIRIEIEAQAAILKKEKELEEARKKLEQIRQAKYANRPPEDSD